MQNYNTDERTICDAPDFFQRETSCSAVQLNPSREEIKTLDQQKSTRALTPHECHIEREIRGPIH